MTVPLLVVEDDREVRTFLADNLTADGFELTLAGCLREARRALRERPVAVALVDVSLPDGSGLELVRTARSGREGFNPAQRFLVLSGLASEVDRVRALRVGADDFLAKPYAYTELYWRVRALLRRGSSPLDRPPLLRAGQLRVNAATRAVTLAGAPVRLSGKEFDLLRVLATDPERVHTKAELLHAVWGHSGRSATRTLDSHACRLRGKLGHGFVINVWGVGYRLHEPVLAA